MHKCFLNPKNKKYVYIKPSPDLDGYLVTHQFRIYPVDKDLKIQKKRKFGLSMNDGKTKIVSGIQHLGMGVRIYYCPICGDKL